MKCMLLSLFWALLVPFTVSANESCTPPHAVILMYHHVSDQTPASTSVSPTIFKEHLEFLAEHDFKVMDLITVVSKLRQGESLPDSVVVLTFDDGYESVYTEAFPLLKKLGWPFTVFVCPEAINKRQGPVATWDQLREMSNSGATIASHGLNHEFMTRPRPDEDSELHLRRLERELVYAQKQLVDQHLGEANLLAFPFGEYSPSVQTVVQRLNLTAFGQHSGAVGPNSDLTCLPRFPMAADFASLDGFGDKVSSLPFPTAMVNRMDPNLDVETAASAAPVLTLILESACLGEGEVLAYASGQGRISCNWLDRQSGFLQIQAPNPLPRGRSRYNVTAPVPGTSRWFWFSQLWIVGQEHQY
jgi:poly-beta-1,6-N-acetyl-D-glucosamine N-deacetylase